MKDYLEGLSKCLRELEEQEDKVKEIAELLYQTFPDHKVLIMGNGGSSSTAQHLAQGLWNAGLIAFSLVDNGALVTAIANDFGYEFLFSKQLLGSIKDKDIVIGISASGDSPNILRGVEVAQIQDVRTVGLSGFGGGMLKGLVDYSIVLSSKDYGQVEDSHMALCHILCKLVEKKVREVN